MIELYTLDVALSVLDSICEAQSLKNKLGRYESSRSYTLKDKKLHVYLWKNHAHENRQFKSPN